MRFVLAVAAICLVAGPLRAQSTGDWMVRLTLQGQSIEGSPLAWDASAVHLLGRDGRLWTFSPDRATAFRQTASRFHSYSVSEFRAALLRDLGGQFEVTGTTHYLVAHRRDEGDRWAERFEQLYRSFVHYFTVHGFAVSQPPFPLLGIVCRDREEFERYSAEHASATQAGVLGYYNLETNRIVLYDMGDGSAAWQRNASVLIHEATHQTAFNTGVHSRYTPPPRWLAEGLAMLFEAPGVYDSHDHPESSERVNPDRLRQFLALAPQHKPAALVTLIGSDDPFQEAPAAAYAESWALTFYLVENEPRKYARYLALTARHEPFTSSSREARVAEFTTVFGSDWRMLEARMLRFLNGASR
jgi:hypothetical protein